MHRVAVTLAFLAVIVTATVLRGAIVVGVTTALMNGCAQQAQGSDMWLVHNVQELPLSRLPADVFRIEETEQGNFRCAGSEYSDREVMTLLNEQPDGFLAAGILLELWDKSTLEIRGMLTRFCVKRNVDLYMIVPVNIRPEFEWWEVALWVVQSTRGRR